MFKIATPISSLFDNPHHAEQIMEKSDCLECRDRSIYATFPRQELFHCEIQPIHNLGKSDFSYLEKILGLKPDLKLITFHAASSCDQPYVEGNMFQTAGVQYSRKEMLQNARKNFSKIKAILGGQVKIAIENNNYYPTEAYFCITDAGFIREIVYENDIYFLFDIAHARVTAHNRKLDYEDYTSGLPLERMVQIHISRYAINENNIGYDAHNLPDEREWKELTRIISDNRSVHYLTVEYYKDKDKLIRSLKEAKEIANELS